MLPEDALRGSFTPMVTPFRDGQVDLDEFERLIERQIEDGSQGIVVTGTTGEPTSLTPLERISLFTRAVKVSGGRLQVVAAPGSPNHEETMYLIKAAEGAGVDAVLVVSPAFVQPSQTGLLEHFRTVAEATALPLLIYNIPGRAAVSVHVDTLARLAEGRANVVGVKHASANLDYVTEILVRLGDQFRVFCGAESLSYPMLAVGGAGLMSAVGNLFPRAIAALCRATATGDHQTALTLHRALYPVNQAVFFDSNPVPLKAMLELRGISSSEVRPPLTQLDEATRDRVARILERYDAAWERSLPRDETRDTRETLATNR